MAARLIEPGRHPDLQRRDGRDARRRPANAAEEQGITNVEFKQLQLEWIDLPAASVDVILCRWGGDAHRRSRRGAARVPPCAQAGRPSGAAVWDVREEKPLGDDSGWGAERASDTRSHRPGPHPACLRWLLPAQLRELLEGTGFMRSTSRRCRSHWQWASVLDGSVRPRDRSHNFATVWAGLSDEERQRLRLASPLTRSLNKDETGAFGASRKRLAAAAPRPERRPPRPRRRDRGGRPNSCRCKAVTKLGGLFCRAFHAGRGGARLVVCEFEFPSSRYW